MMVLKTIDLDSIKRSLEELLAELEEDSEILLTKGDMPIARIASEKSPHIPEKKPRILGLHEGQGWISEDFTAELPDSFWFGSKY